MNDYLDNLIAKSLGLTEIVAPRPISLFEPLPSDAGSLAPEYYSLEQDSAPRLTPASLESNLDVAASMRLAESSEKPPPPRPAQSDQPSQHPVQSIDRSLAQSAPALIPHQPVSGDDGQRVDLTERAAPVNQHEVDSHPATPEHAPLRVVLRATTPADRQATSAPEAPPLLPAHATAPDRAIPITPAEPAQTLLVAPAPLRERAPDQERESPSSDRAAVPPPAPEAAAPTIKITIGRVDVRAVMSEQPSQRPTPERRNPALSLEEYLKQRSGGKL